MALRGGSGRLSEPIRVIVADDHPLFLEGVLHSLESAGDVAVVGQATGAAGAVRLAVDHVPDVALLDIAMPGGGLAAARDISTACPATRIVMLTVSEDEDDLLGAMKAGASGYVLKGVSADELVSVLRRVAEGQAYVSPALAWSLLHEMSAPRAASPLEELTDRERAVLELVARGMSNQDVGGQLGLAEKTIKHYVTNILAKLQVRSRVEAALLAQKAGLGRLGT